MVNQVDVRNGDKEKKEEDCYWRTAKFSWGLFHGWHLFHDFKKQILHGWGLLHYFINQILHLKIWKSWEEKKIQRIFLEGEEIRPKFRRYWLSIWHKFPLILSPILRPSNADILQKRSSTRRTTRRKCRQNDLVNMDLEMIDE